MIQANAAGLIWKQDEKQARAVFKTAIAGLAEITSAMDQSDPQYDSMAQKISELRRSEIRLRGRIMIAQTVLSG